MSPNILSVDVEDYFHVEAFSSVVNRSQWNSYVCRVEENTKRLLDIVDQGVGTVADLEEQIVVTGRVFLWWD